MGITVRDIFILAVHGQRPSARFKTAARQRVEFTSQDNGNTFMTINGNDAAMIDPDNNCIHLASTHGTGVPSEVRMIGHTLESMDYWQTGETYGDGGSYMDVWHRHPMMYLMTDATMMELIQSPTREWITGDHQYIMGEWSEHSSFALVGVGGHHVFAEVPEVIPSGCRVFAVEYRGPHDVRQHSDGHMVHAFGAIKPLHEVTPPIGKWNSRETGEFDFVYAGASAYEATEEAESLEELEATVTHIIDTDFRDAVEHLREHHGLSPMVEAVSNEFADSIDVKQVAKVWWDGNKNR